MITKKIDQDLKTAQKEKDEVRLSVLRMVRSEMKNKEIENKGELSEEDVLSILEREAKKRRESIEQFKEGGREDLVEKEKKELEIIGEYLPEQLSEEELTGIVEEAISEVGASTPADMGKVMGALMPKVKGKAPGDLVSKKVKELLSNQNGE